MTGRMLIVPGLLLALLPAPAGAGEVTEVRLGRQPDRIRVVLDLDAPAQVSQAFSADLRTLTLTLSGVGVRAPQERSSPSMAPLAGWRLEPLPDGGGSRLELRGTQPLRLLALERGKPGQAKPPHKIIVDLALKPAAGASAPLPVAVPAPAPAQASPPAPGVVGLSPAPGTPAFVFNPAESAGGFSPQLPAENRRMAVAPPAAPPAPVAATPSAPASSSPPSLPGAEPADRKRSEAIERLLAEARTVVETARQPADYTRAFGLFRQAADSGSPIGAFALGQMYRMGVGVAPDDVLAAFWYGEAARSQYSPAEMNLGVMQLRGIGINADPVKGLELVKRAAAHGNEPARRLLERVARGGIDPAAAAAAAETESRR
jgi:hypothetical protein